MIDYIISNRGIMLILMCTWVGIISYLLGSFYSVANILPTSIINLINKNMKMTLFIFIVAEIITGVAISFGSYELRHKGELDDKHEVKI